MNDRLLQWLQCPWCRGDFAVDAFVTSDAGVEEGLLRCTCGRMFPIVRGIPRVLPDAFALHRDFADTYRSRLPPELPRAADASEPHAKAIQSTRESFGYQWTRFSEMVVDFRENFLQYISPVDEQQTGVAHGAVLRTLDAVTATNAELRLNFNQAQPDSTTFGANVVGAGILPMKARVAVVSVPLQRTDGRWKYRDQLIRPGSALAFETAGYLVRGVITRVALPEKDRSDQ